MIFNSDGVDYKIPGIYVRSITTNKETGAVSSLLMRGYISTFLPVDVNVDPETKGEGWGDTVDVILSKRSVSHYTGNYLATLLHGKIINRHQKDVNGYNIYVIDRFLESELHISDDKKNFYYCRPDGSVEYPDCETKIPFGTDSNITLRFGKDQISSFDKMADRIENILICLR